MKDFAVLDDSMVYREGIYAYSHALIVYDELPKVRCFIGTKEEVYSQERAIKEFLESFIPEEYSLYACNHYMLYRSIWEELVFQEVNGQKLPKLIHQHFVLAHHIAKESAKAKLEEVVSRRNKIGFSVN